MKTSQPIYSHTPIEAERGLCAGGHRLAAEAGVRAMQQGGNAIDALTAAAFVSFVVEPASCGIAGYAHLSIWLEARQRFVSIDGYVRAPGAARPDMFEVDDAVPATYYGHPFTRGNKAMAGPLAPGVPGAVAAFCQAQRDFGRLPLAEVLAPAIEAAEAGVPFIFSDRLSIAEHALGVELLPDTAAVLLPGGRPPSAPRDEAGGQRLDTSRLAATLKAIADRGPAGFYDGPVAQALAGYLRARGGILSSEDLAGYRTRTLFEQPLGYRDCRYVTCFDQVAYQALNILGHFDLAAFGPDSFEYRHLVAEALALAFTDTITHYGDPDFVESPVDGLASPAFAAQRKELISLERALPRPVTPGDPWPFAAEGPVPDVVTDPRSQARQEGTSQAATVDAEGNMASCCISVGSAFGALVYVPELGIFLNNGMQNYDPRPGLPNSIAPGKMPTFAAPAIVATRNGRSAFAASGSGGYRIETGVLHSFMNWLDHGMAIQRAVDRPRIHSQGGATYVDPAVPAEVRERLSAVGHDLVLQPPDPPGWPYGRVCAVVRDADSGLLSGGASPSWHSAIAGF